MNDVNIFVPQESSAAESSSLFAGLSVQDTITPSQTASMATNLLTTSTVSSRPSESTTNISSANTSIFAPQTSASVTSNQPMASVSRVSSNTTYQPTSSSSSSGILQPQLTTSVTSNQSTPAASGPILGATSNHPPSSTPLQPKPATSYNNTNKAYQPPPVASSNTLETKNASAGSTKNPPITEPPPPYPGDHKYAAATARFRTGSQQPTSVQSMKPNLNQKTTGSTMHSNINSGMQSPPTTIPSNFRSDTRQPQSNLLQSAQPVVSPQITSSTGTQLLTQSHTTFGTNMLQPQIIGSTGMQSSAHNPTIGTNVLQPQVAGSTGMQPSAHNPTTLGANILQPQIAGSTRMQPSAHNPTIGTNILQPQQSNMLMSTTQPISTVVMPQMTGTTNVQPSFSNFTQLPTSYPQQIQGAPKQGAANFVDPRAHGSAVLMPQKTSMAPTPSAGTSHGDNFGTMNTASNGLFQQPLITAPPAQQGTGYMNMMSPGANPFSDINNLL